MKRSIIADDARMDGGERGRRIRNRKVHGRLSCGAFGGLIKVGSVGVCVGRKDP